MKFRIYIVSILQLMVISVSAQRLDHLTIDSLLRALPHHKNDTGLVNILNSLVYQYRNIDVDSSTHYFYRAITLSTDIKYTLGVADAYLYQSMALSNMGDNLRADSFSQYALSLYDRDKDNNTYRIQSRKGSLYNNLGIINIRIGNLPNARKYFLATMKIRIAYNDYKGQADALNNLGVISMGESKYDEAADFYTKSLKIKERLNDSLGISNAESNLGNVFRHLGDYPKALQYHLSALRMRQMTYNKRDIASSYQNIGNIYGDIGNHNEALNYHLSALKLNAEIGNRQGMADCYNNLAIEYQCLGNHSEELNSHLKALQIYKQINSREGIAESLNNIAAVYIDKREFLQALPYLTEATRMYTDLNIKSGIAICNRDLGVVYAFLKKFKKSRSCLNLSLKTSLDIKNIECIRDSYNGLGVLDSIQGNFLASLKDFQMYVLYKDSGLNESNTKKITQLQDQYEFNKKADSSKAATDQQIAITAANHRTLVRTGTISVLALILLLCGGFYFYTTRQKDKFMLQVSAVRQEALNAQMSDHFISNTIATVNRFIRSNDKERASEYLQLFSGLVRKVLENASKQFVTLQDDLELVKDYVELEKSRFPAGQFDFNIDVDPEIDARYALVPPMIFQVLAENAIHHGLQKRANGRLSVVVRRNDKLMECQVEDNGIGRSATLRAKTDNVHKSFGGGIAEKLIKTVSLQGKKAHFQITDLMDTRGDSLGTLVTFTLPYYSYN